VPIGFPVGSYTGTVHVRSGSQSIPDIFKVLITVVTPSSTTIPSGPSAPSPDRIITLPSGKKMVRDELTVVLKFGTPDPSTVIKTIATATHGQITGSTPELLLYDLRYPVTSPDQLEQIRSIIKTYPEVEAVGNEPLGDTLQY